MADRPIKMELHDTTAVVDLIRDATPAERTAARTMLAREAPDLLRFFGSELT